MAVLSSDPVLILGGGLMGLSIAHALAQKGQAVVVISRCRKEAAGFVAAGMLAPHAEGLGGGLLALGQASLQLIPRWVAGIEEDSGLSCGLHTTGIVVPFASTAERDAFPTACFGEVLERESLEREVPGIAPIWRTGLLFRQDGQLDNRRFLMRALEAACVNRGVAFLEGSEVVSLLPQSSAGSALGGVQIRRAHGPLQTLACSRAVLACGAWSAQLLPDLPVFPVKGQMLSLQAPRQGLRRVLFGPGTYLVPREDGLVVVGATSEPDAGFDRGLTPSAQIELERGVASLLPSARSWPQMERWCGFRPCTPDQGPLLGEGPIPGLWLATGHFRNGVLLAAVTAEAIAARLTGAAADPDAMRWLEVFRVDRFQG